MKRASVLATSLMLATVACNDNSDQRGIADEDAFNVNGSVVLSSVVAAKPSSRAIVDGVDYVYAVNTMATYGSEWRKKVPLNADGSFSIDLSKGDPWVLAFIDSSQTGSAMIKGIFKASQLDSVVPKTDATAAGTDLGDLTVDEVTGLAEMDTAAYDTFIGDLGMTSTEATVLGGMDDLMLRYINPDIDGNGVIDMDDPNAPELNITFWHNYEYGTGLLSAVQAGTALPTDATVTFDHAAPELRVQKTASGIFSAMPGKVDVSWSNQGNHNASSVSWSASTPDTLATFDDAADTGFKVMFPQNVTQVPSGTYTYALYTNEADMSAAATLTFTNVNTPADSSVTTNFVFPFPVFNTNAAGEITSVDYTWMKKTATGFVAADSADIELMVGKKEAEIKWHVGDVNNNPESVFIGFSPWQEDFATTGTLDISNATVSSSAALQRANISTLSISFVSKLGMWMKMNISS